MKKTIAFVCAIVTVAAFAITGCRKNTPSDYVNTVYTAMKNKDFKTVVEMMPGMDTVTEDEKEGTIEMMKLFDGFSGGVTDFKILSEDISADGKKATVRIQVTYGTGEIEEDEAYLEKTKKGWRPVSPVTNSVEDYDMEGYEELDINDYLDEEELKALEAEDEEIESDL